MLQTLGYICLFVVADAICAVVGDFNFNFSVVVVAVAV